MKVFKIKWRYLFVVTLLLCSCGNKLIGVSKGVTRSIYPDMIGVNGNLTEFDHPWDYDSLVDAVSELQVANFRYPAGSLGNYWDWDTGWIDKTVPDSLMIKWVVEQGLTKNKKTYTLENFAKGQRKLGFTPVFMLNILSKDLDHSVRNLLRAEELGLPIKYIELGNELYFNLPFETAIYPTPEDYGRTCQFWIDSLKTHFPDAKYAILGTDLERKPRHTDWTRRALKYCNNADAVVFHKYSPSGIDGKQEKKAISAGTEGLTDASTATRKAPSNDLKTIQEWEIGLLKNDTTYANLLNTAEQAASSYTKLNIPESMEIWATEFNMRDDKSAIRGTWANALYLAKYYDTFLNAPVTLTNVHNITGNLFAQVFTDITQLDFIKWKKVKSKPWQLTAGGLSTHFFARASKGKTKATQLNFSESNSIIDDRGHKVSTFGGWLFESDTAKSILIINYGRNEVTINLSDIPDFKKATSYSSNLDVYITNGVDDVLVKETSFQSKIMLKPFSFTLIQ
ncbi:hypothetical protein [Mariniflexile sp.]|uniref:hypothetical protein n=1 Tax=Mariniflexile sp. TaxID=1979402 RepID=UPI0040470EB0